MKQKNTFLIFLIDYWQNKMSKVNSNKIKFRNKVLIFLIPTVLILVFVALNILGHIIHL